MRLSPLHQRHLQLGAAMRLEGGWQVPERYATPEAELAAIRSGSGLCDLSHHRKWVVKAGPEAQRVGGAQAAARSGQVERLSGVGPAESGSFWRYELAPGHALIAAESPDDPSGAAPSPVEPRPGIAVTEMTSALACLALAGPRSRELLSAATSLNLTERALPSGRCAQSSVAKCHAVLARLDAGYLPAYRVFVTRDLAEFVWDALLQAGSAFGLTPVGLDAWRLLETTER